MPETTPTTTTKEAVSTEPADETKAVDETEPVDETESVDEMEELEPVKIEINAFIVGDETPITQVITVAPKDNEITEADIFKRYRDTIMKKIEKSRNPEKGNGWVKIGKFIYNLDNIVAIQIIEESEESDEPEGEGVEENS